MSELKYSVIIPAYNAESTIRRCLDSLLAEQREDVELIIVNDGSTDRTREILDSYGGAVKAIHQSNHGVSYSRNKGLESANGKYILFVDSDDYVPERYFEQMDLMPDDYDMCVFMRHIIGGKPWHEEKLFDQISRSEWLNQVKLLLSSREMMSPINKRYRNSIIKENQIRYVDSLYSSEDFNFCLEYTLKCQSIQAFTYFLYVNDITNNESLSRKPRKDLTDQLTKGFKHAADLVQSSDRDESEKTELLKEIDYLYVKNSCTCIAETFKFKQPSYKKYKAEYRQICEEFTNSFVNSDYKNIIHRSLRFLIAKKIIFPIYFVTKIHKG